MPHTCSSLIGSRWMCEPAGVCTDWMSAVMTAIQNTCMHTLRVQVEFQAFCFNFWSCPLLCSRSSGTCECKTGVYGPKCDECHPGFFHFSSTGCRPCQCSNHTNNCHPQSGESTLFATILCLLLYYFLTYSKRKRTTSSICLVTMVMRCHYDCFFRPAKLQEALGAATQKGRILSSKQDVML